MNIKKNSLDVDIFCIRYMKLCDELINAYDSDDSREVARVLADKTKLIEERLEAADGLHLPALGTGS